MMLMPFASIRNALVLFAPGISETSLTAPPLMRRLASLGKIVGMLGEAIAVSSSSHRILGITLINVIA